MTMKKKRRKKDCQELPLDAVLLERLGTKRLLHGSPLLKTIQ